MACENSKRVNYDYKVGNKVLLTQEGILRKAEGPYSKGQFYFIIQNNAGGDETTFAIAVIHH
jgi:hypothetical protein